MAACSHCGSELPPAARFCPACGAAVGARRGEERKVVTVLFADIVDSTVLADERDPEDVRAALRPQIARMREELERYGGTFEKYIGDAVMAVFGAPIAHEDDPERAVRAALAIRKALPGVRVAVETGEAVVSLGATPGTGEGIATGDVVNTTFRIEESATANTVLVGEATYRATHAMIEYGERRLLEAKGKAEPVAVYEARRALVELKPTYAGPPLAPLVGRREELSLVLDTISRARRDRTVQLVTLVGVPGIGKSRLVWELQRALEDEPELLTWRRGRCLPYGDGVTFWALGEMVKAQAQIGPGDDSGIAAEKLAGCVRELVADDGDAAWVEAHVRPLVGLGVQETVAEERREQVFAAWRRLFESLAESVPLVLVFEDLHWADEGLLDFVEHLADWARGAPLVLLCTARPELYENRSGWGGRPNAATITLPPLSGDETRLLVAHLLRDRAAPAEVERALLANAGGNPFYAEEFVRMLLDRGQLQRRGAEWTLAEDGLALPESVQGIIASRLDGLEPEDKALLQDAAVFGRTFWPQALATIRGGDEQRIERQLHALERKEFVGRVRAPTAASTSEYSFHHSLTRDVAYGQIPRASRAAKHAAAAAWLESLGRSDDHAETVAHHYLCALEFAHASGQDIDSFAAAARSALRFAGERALVLHAHATAAGFFAAALELAPTSEPERLELVYSAASSAFAAGRASADELAHARDELLAGGDVERGAELESTLGAHASARGEQSESLAHARRAVELLHDAAPSRSKAHVLRNLATHLLLAGEYEEAIRTGRSAVEIAEELGLAEVRARALSTIGLARTSSGDLAGLDDLERSVEIARETSSPETVAALTNLAGIHLYLGNLERSFELRNEARRAAERFGDVMLTRWLEVERAGELYWNGRWDEALEIVDALVASVEAGQPHYLESPSRVVRGRIRLARGELDQALADSDAALEAARRTRDIHVLYPALAFSARALVEIGDAARAAYPAEELLGRMRPADVLPGWLAWSDLAVALLELGRGSELVEWGGAAGTASSRWLEAALAYAAGDFARAADAYMQIGALPEEAHARQRAGSNAAAEAFFGRVGAARYLRATAASD